MPVFVPTDPVSPMNPIPPYASVLELEDFLGYVPPNAERLVTRASRRVRRATVCAQYETNAQGLPTDPEYVSAFREATLEEVASMLEDGDRAGTGTNRATKGFTIGRVKVDATASGVRNGASRTGQLCDSAWQVLFDAGLIQWEPQAP